MARWAPPELVTAAVAGDEPAVERLIAAVWPGCFRLAASVVGDRALAQDAAQEACVVVLRKIRSLRHPEAFDAWLYRIVMREAIRAGRRRDVSVENPERCLGAMDTASIDVWRALAALSPPLREATVLFYFDDLTSDEIASILRIPHATVRTRLARARERLRGVLGDYAGEPGSAPLEVRHYAI
ncbi:MAG TPA: sigma-70 family RNA polymerase sigma factor [Verrucomicrobiae bacterium]|nr:sigma-70 family RNA polymerase sigma factor [Verrucomicrobiae bacterium]